MPKRRTPRPLRSRKAGGQHVEWIGGRLSPPFFIHDREEPYRAELAIWMETGSGLVVGQNLTAPEDAEGAVAQALLDALERPLAGPSREPDAIRVADASLATEVREVIGDSIPVAVGPTRELDALLEMMIESMPTGDEEESYLEDGRIPPTAISELFVVAKLLYGLAPWKTATEDQVLRLDVPALGVEGACVSIIGRLGESLGLLIFPSLAGWTAFARAAEEPHAPGRRPNLGSGLLSLCYESAAELPAAMRREAMSHGWPVFDAEAYPRVEHRDAAGAVRPLTDRDVKLVAACATSLCTFFIKHGRRFAADQIEPVSESYFDDDDLEVRFTLPYEAFRLFQVETGAAPVSAAPGGEQRRRVGRNDLCPCGSGRKYKKCHLPLDEAEASGQAARDAAPYLDDRLVPNLSRFAMARFGSKWRRFTKDFDGASDVLQLAIPWSVFHYRVDGATVLDWYRREKGQRLSRAEDAWLEAQRASWLSVWEVTDVKPGASLTLRDLLTGETRNVSDVTASQALVVRDAILGRVVDHEGVSLLRGVHPRSLPPIVAAEVVRRARGRLRRKRAVPVDRVRDEAIGRYLIRRWEETVAELDARHEVPPQLCNTDGDPILLTTDHFDIAPGGAAAAVQAQLAGWRVSRPPMPTKTHPFTTSCGPSARRAPAGRSPSLVRPG